MAASASAPTSKPTSAPADSKKPATSVTTVDCKLDPKVEKRLKFFNMTLSQLADKLMKLNPDDKRLENKKFEDYDIAFSALNCRVAQQTDHVMPERTPFHQKLDEIEKKFDDEKTRGKVTSTEMLLLSMAYGKFYHSKTYDANKLFKFGQVGLVQHQGANVFCLLQYTYLCHCSDISQLNYDINSAYSGFAKQGMTWAQYQYAHSLKVPGNKDCSQIESLLKESFHKGLYYSLKILVNFILKEKRTIDRQELISLIARYKKMKNIMGLLVDDFENCGISYNKTTDQAELNENEFDEWLLQQGIIARNGDKPIVSRDDFKLKIFSLITKDIQSFLEAIQDAIQQYLKVHPQLKEHQQKMIVLARTLENSFLQFLDGKIRRMGLMERIHNFFHESNGGSGEHSMKYLIIKRLLRHYINVPFLNAHTGDFASEGDEIDAGRAYDSIKPGFFTRAGFVEQMNEMIEMGQAFTLEFLIPMGLDKNEVSKKDVNTKAIPPVAIGGALPSAPESVVAVSAGVTVQYAPLPLHAMGEAKAAAATVAPAVYPSLPARVAATVSSGPVYAPLVAPAPSAAPTVVVVPVTYASPAPTAAPVFVPLVTSPSAVPAVAEQKTKSSTRVIADSVPLVLTAADRTMMEDAVIGFEADLADRVVSLDSAASGASARSVAENPAVRYSGKPTIAKLPMLA